MNKMREIKFRVWDKKRKVMLGSCDVPYVDPNDCGHLVYCDILGLAIDTTGGMYILDECGNYMAVDENDYVIMQYTGLKAKNGKEIYEGDIVKAIVRYVTSDILLLAECKTKEIVGVVEWDEGGWWCLKTQDEYLPKVGFYAVEEFVDVLGNVYENPELHAEI